jgi:hypothetical protein
MWHHIVCIKSVVYQYPIYRILLLEKNHISYTFFRHGKRIVYPNRNLKLKIHGFTNTFYN